ncbi:MAG: DUF2950 domain-containing protein [Verrucomicrobia bacterium]|nr:MAG: DUF2950 domain-containing protein [Verrucomicrobiota bacterium]
MNKSVKTFCARIPESLRRSSNADHHLEPAFGLNGGNPRQRRGPVRGRGQWSVVSGQWSLFRGLWSVVLSGALSLSLAAFAQNATSTGRKFASPEQAIDALRLATTGCDTNALRELFGPGALDVENPDRVQATNEWKTFSAALAEKTHLVHVSDSRIVLEVGTDFWPFPVPIVKQSGRWVFDTAAGKDELLSRRIGKNELATLPVMRAYVDAQREYASSDHNGDGVLQYAQRLVSSPGKEDGLYWPPDDATGRLSPLGPLVASAAAEGYVPVISEDEDEAERGPFHGYLFKILTRQGKHAPGGKYNYVINGRMIGGFAMVAWPADYGSSGIMTFIVNQQGRVYQKDLGPKTSRLASHLKAYDPDPSWTLSPD